MYQVEYNYLWYMKNKDYNVKMIQIIIKINGKYFKKIKKYK
jgi:hypothetical protein